MSPWACSVDVVAGQLSSALNWARRDLEWDVPSPARGRRLREPKGRVRWLRQDEAERLIAAAESEPQAPYLADFIRLALTTGCRRDDLLWLEWRRVDSEARLLHLEARHTKAGKRRSIPLNALALDALSGRKAWFDRRRQGTARVFANENGERVQSIKRSWATACRRAGIDGFRVHDLRHTSAAWLVSAGEPLMAIRAHLVPENIRAAVAVLEELDGNRTQERRVETRDTPHRPRGEGLSL